MKRNTLILLLLTAGIGIAVYFLEIKPGTPRDVKPDESKPAFTFKREDIESISINRVGQTVALEEKDGKWTITQPVAAAASQSAVDSLIGSLTSARVERKLSPSGDEMRSFGLENPAVTVEVTLKNGQSQTLKLGTKDFSGLSVYAQIGDSKEAVLTPASVLTSSDKSLNDLRDKAILGASQFDIKGITLRNENGQIALAKEGGEWELKKPVEAGVDAAEMNSFLSEITSGEADEFVSQTADDLAKYGLDNPKITLTAQLNDGSERVISASVKDDNHYAKASSRAEVVKISSSLYDKLNVKASDLRSKELFKLNRENLSKIEIKNPNLRLTAEKSGDKWVVKEPADKKDKDASASKIISPFETKADEIVESPGSDVRAKLAKPAVEARLTYKDGKVIEVKISSADGDNAYVTVNGHPEVFKVKKQMLDDLSFKAADF
ncbi:MAG: hypothetical protein DMF61_08690 [Blastocatellia bacterium AA13]|nr:MAG: hypothetical protein DMF61_08690 [Blastocatellia bacterium AA13]